jgi:hypothetical protein
MAGASMYGAALILTPPDHQCQSEHRLVLPRPTPGASRNRDRGPFASAVMQTPAGLPTISTTHPDFP